MDNCRDVHYCSITQLSSLYDDGVQEVERKGVETLIMYHGDGSPLCHVDINNLLPKSFFKLSLSLCVRVCVCVNSQPVA